MDEARGSVELARRLGGLRAGGRRVGLVPTMGNLHAGHLALVRQARELADRVVVSIFVNPFQFGQGEDFATYPRTLEADLGKLREHGADLVFLPDVADIYPEGPEAVTRVEVPGLGAILCGETRPTFFRGVATVVCILLNLVRPDVAVFGEKDYQQLLVIRRLVRDLHLGVEIAAGATVREADGLAMSSRNAYLSPEDRARAAAIRRALGMTREAIRGGARDYPALCTRAIAELEAAGLRPEYFTVRRAKDLSLPGAEEEPLRILAAARVGSARLIDNVAV
jgi:pantoate--beta-alanine ligase